MIAPLAKFIDWSVLQVNSLHRPPFSGQDVGLEEALKLVDGPDFIPAESYPAQIEFDGSLQIRFPSPRPGTFQENNTVYGRLYRCPERWQERPAIILLHGWNSALSHRFRFSLAAASEPDSMPRRWSYLFTFNVARAGMVACMALTF
jgi:hypothetical protein